MSSTTSYRTCIPFRGNNLLLQKEITSIPLLVLTMLALLLVLLSLLASTLAQSCLGHSVYLETYSGFTSTQAGNLCTALASNNEESVINIANGYHAATYSYMSAGGSVSGEVSGGYAVLCVCSGATVFITSTCWSNQNKSSSSSQETSSFFSATRPFLRNRLEMDSTIKFY